MQQNFTTLNRWAALERPTFPVNPWIFRVPEECWAAITGVPPAEYYGYFRKRFCSATWRKGRSSTFFSSSKNLASSSQELRPDITETARRQGSEMKREPLNTSIPLPHFQWESGMLNHTGGTCSHSGMIDSPKFPISELHLRKFPDSMEFQSWKVIFARLKHVRKQQTLISQCNRSEKLRWQSQLTNLWHRYRLWCEQISPTSICLMRWLRLHWKDFSTKHVHFRKRVSVEEQRAQKYHRFLGGRQIAYMIHEHFRASGAYEAVQGLPDLFSIRLHNDDVQDFDVRWDQALLSVNKRHAFRCDPGRIVQVKITGLCSASDRLGFVRSRNRSK